MKGVEAVIAIILILMIVIALAALAYTWFSGIFSSLTSTAGTAVTSTTNAMATQFRIEAAKYNGATNPNTLNISVRNIGTQSFNVSKSSVYIGGVYATPGGFNPPLSLAASGTSVIYNVPNTSAACGATVTVTIETGLTDSRTISC